MIWIDEELAGKLEIINDVAKVNNEDLDKVIKRLSDETNTMSECLDENVLRFKLHAKQVRDNYKKVVDEELDQTYRLWEECEEKRDEVDKKVKATLPVIKSIGEELGKCNKAIENVNTYGIDKLINLVERFKDIPDDEKEMLAMLLNYKNYRREN